MSPPRRESGVRLAASEKARTAWHRKNEARLSSVSADMLASANAVIALYTSDTRFEGMLEENPDEWLALLESKIRKLSNKQHVKRVALAFALDQKAQSDFKIGAALARTLHAKRQKPTTRTQYLHLAVESVIKYGDDTPEGKHAARKLHNRDVQAIRHLEARNILPDQVEALSKKKGEGLNNWARGGNLNTPSDGEGGGSAQGRRSEQGLKHVPDHSTIEDRAVALRASAGRGERRDNDHDGRRPALPVNVIEWRSGKGKTRTVRLPETPQAVALISNIFDILSGSADYFLSKNVAEVIEATSGVMRGIGLAGSHRGRGVVPGHQLPQFEAIFNELLSALNERIATMPMPKKQIDESQAEISALKAIVSPRNKSTRLGKSAPDRPHM